MHRNIRKKAENDINTRFFNQAILLMNIYNKIL
jgi:hypothetical protein